MSRLGHEPTTGYYGLIFLCFQAHQGFIGPEPGVTAHVHSAYVASKARLGMDPERKVEIYIHVRK